MKKGLFKYKFRFKKTEKLWLCMVIHRVPLDKSCESQSNPRSGVVPCTFSRMDEPANWRSSDFYTSGWGKASVHSANVVSPKGSYDAIDWDSRARLIWGHDLEIDNTILCKVTINEE